LDAIDTFYKRNYYDLKLRENKKQVPFDAGRDVGFDGLWWVALVGFGRGREGRAGERKLIVGRNFLFYGEESKHLYSINANNKSKYLYSLNANDESKHLYSLNANDGSMPFNHGLQLVPWLQLVLYLAAVPCVATVAFNWCRGFNGDLAWLTTAPWHGGLG
jgi:hypothetical protein